MQSPHEGGLCRCVLGELPKAIDGGAKGFCIQASNKKNERMGHHELRELRAVMLGRKSLITKPFRGESDGRKTKVCYTVVSKRNPPHRGWSRLLNPDVLEPSGNARH